MYNVLYPVLFQKYICKLKYNDELYICKNGLKTTQISHKDRKRKKIHHYTQQCNRSRLLLTLIAEQFVKSWFLLKL